MATKDPNEVLCALIDWAELGKALKARYEEFYRLTGASVESPMWAPVFRLWEAHTEAVAKAVGDTEEWLSWYDLENEMGAKKLIVRAPNEEAREVCNLEDLAWVITGATPSIR